MKYTIDKQEKYFLIRMEEEKLDSTMAPRLKSDFITYQAEGAKNLIVDLSEVKYIDSSGLSALLVGNRLFHEHEGIFVIASINDHVMKLIKISQLDTVLNLLPTVEEAIDAVFMNEIEGDLKKGTSDN
ncbi:MAG: STAS domain-containing protein [Bacteroidota bacterium]|nr:STAS domain-containing protein [Bacteroidota bacterium]